MVLTISNTGTRPCRSAVIEGHSVGIISRILPGVFRDSAGILPGFCRHLTSRITSKIPLRILFKFLSFIPRGSCQDPARILRGSCEDPARILFRIFPGFFQDLTWISLQGSIPGFLMGFFRDSSRDSSGIFFFWIA